MPKDDIQQALEFSVSAACPYLPELFLKNESEIADLLADKEFSAIAQVFKPVLRDVLGAHDAASDETNSNGLGGFLSKLKSK